MKNVFIRGKGWAKKFSISLYPKHDEDTATWIINYARIESYNIGLLLHFVECAAVNEI